MIDALKTLLRDRLGLPSWAVLAVLGLAAHLALNALLRRPLASPLGLLAPLLLGIAIEAFEIWRHYRAIGLFAPGNDPLWQIGARHAGDVALMLALPLAWVLLARVNAARFG